MTNPARFDRTHGKVTVWAMRRGRGIKLYVIPLTHLRNVASVYIPLTVNMRGEQQETPERTGPAMKKRGTCLAAR
jgi:hypothetical protein